MVPSAVGLFLFELEDVFGLDGHLVQSCAITCGSFVSAVNFTTLRIDDSTAVTGCA